MLLGVAQDYFVFAAMLDQPDCAGEDLPSPSAFKL